jgi:predicted ATPase
VPQAVADVLGVPDGAGTVPDRLARYLRDRSCLLLVDNCEHLVDAGAVLVEHLLRPSPSTVAKAATTTASPRIIHRSCRRVMPTARSRPISRVRSMMDRARVFVRLTGSVVQPSPKLSCESNGLRATPTESTVSSSLLAPSGP